MNDSLGPNQFTIQPPSPVAEQIADLMRSRRTLVLTGAGVSTGSGLPDYRGTGGGATPTVDIDMFHAHQYWRNWVWQRNHETWHNLLTIEPNPAHHALAQLEQAELVTGIATQNIDGLHSLAGSQNVWELHGTYQFARCTQCDKRLPRAEYAVLLDQLNPNWPTVPGDIAILAEATAAAKQLAQESRFHPAPCPYCGGIMKPDIVMFGEALPPAMDYAMSAANECDVILIVGTSLIVSTGAWVARQAWARQADVVIINQGPTALDRIADIRCDDDASTLLPAIAQALGI
ncbi:SIR2 family NAD-dependent protein deacylase [Arcanobacterium phocae]|uniref:SIR2 family NAD-dependent protein deacylase n=1 Tax=Arcanobacterium phocae TaxID=131112 RepID=UPI001C0FF937|nr:Sir2 family NAD-dependent protein deacetylase [Arcanobacterium phocae]